MRIFKNAWFRRFARRQNISNDTLKDAVGNIEKGLIDADLGGGVIKQRLPRPGKGKSGGYRAIVIYRKGERAFFVFGFPKSERENIDADELAAFKESAKALLALKEKQLEALFEDKALEEVL